MIKKDGCNTIHVSLGQVRNRNIYKSNWWFSMFNASRWIVFASALKRVKKNGRSFSVNSYKTILITGIVLRIMAALFSEGYGMHDDHFLVVEAAASWADGHDYNNWLPWNQIDKKQPEGHSFTYVGLNFIFFYCCKWIGLIDPKIIMLLNRLIHGLFSILTVYFGIRITEKMSNRSNAIVVGWLLASLAVFPFLSVRNLVEITSIPFLMWGVWLVLKNDTANTMIKAGILIGLAVSFRYQIAIFGVGIGLAFLLKRNIRGLLFFSFGGIAVFCCTQGMVDYFIWGKPFAEFIAYSMYNMNGGVKYLPNSNYLMYVWVLMGVFLFPLGILMLIGFIRSGKQHVYLFIPVLLFLLFHTFYPNRQERFILSILPFFTVLGVIGMKSLSNVPVWNKTWRISFRLFWVMNVPPAFFSCFVYSKKSRVEAMYSLYQSTIVAPRILLEGSSTSKPSMMPKFYSKKWESVFVERIDTLQTPLVVEHTTYDYIFFFGEEEKQKRIMEYKKYYPCMRLHKVCEPSVIDKIAALNPHNMNQYIEVWKTNASCHKSNL